MYEPNFSNPSCAYLIKLEHKTVVNRLGDTQSFEFCTYIFFLTPFFPPLESPLFFPTAILDCHTKREVQKLTTDR
jgi:hypothetical protein